MVKNNQTIAVIGLGLIGGSLCLELNKHYTVLGIDNNPSSVEYALKTGMIHKTGSMNDLKDALAVFVCVNIENTTEVIKEAIRYAGEDTVITDTASVKGNLSVFNKNFIGGHPMAGTEFSGVKAAKNGLFKDKYYVLVSYPQTDAALEKKLCGIIEKTDAKIVTMTAKEHDALAAKFSHLPHAGAYSLVNAIFKGGESGGKSIAGGGFLDSTRVASSDARFWTEVMRLNKENILSAMKDYIDEFSLLKDYIENDDFESVHSFFKKAKETRDSFITKNT